MIIFTLLPSYVGSKKHWVKHLQEFKGKYIVEPFCGSAVLSFNLAGHCLLNDKDPFIYRIINNFDELIVPEEFSYADYFQARGNNDWWKYAFCFQSMSFSGVFRYSRNGYNVPIKPIWRDKNLKARDSYLVNLKHWQELDITVTNLNYYEINTNDIIGSVLIIDPPYQNSQASYNDKSMNYKFFWSWVDSVKDICETMIIFDHIDNLETQNIPVFKTRTMTVNGKYKPNTEAMAIYEKGEWRV